MKGLFTVCSDKFLVSYDNASLRCDDAYLVIVLAVVLQTHFMQCQGDPENFADIDCKLFDSPKPRTMALSVLVVIEVLNAFNR